MIKMKMKKLIRSLVIASGGLFIAATASNAANISFTPAGTQLDEDEILDIGTAPDQQITFNISFDTHFINTAYNSNSFVYVDYSILIDTTELEIVDKPGGGFRHIIALSQNAVLVNPFTVKVLNGLINDGAPDIRLIFHSAYAGSGITGEDVSNSFGSLGPSSTFGYTGTTLVQTVEVQPNDPADLLAQNTPEPGTILSAAVALGWGGWLKRKSSSQQNKTNS
jgi:hypothetical protein